MGTEGQSGWRFEGEHSAPHCPDIICNPISRHGLVLN